MKAWAKVHEPELYAEYELRRETMRRVRIFGIPVLKITTVGRETEIRLFDCIPFLRISRRDRI